MSRPTVVAVGLGPARPELVTPAAVAALDSAAGRPGTLFLRTAVHPSASVALERGAVSFDRLYEQGATFDEVYAGIVEELVDAARHHGRVVYAVPGHPRVAETTVARLAGDERIELETVAGLSFLDLAWARLGVDPLAAGPRPAGVRLVDGGRFAEEAAGERGPLLVAQCWSREVLSGIKLSVPGDGPHSAVLLHHLGLADEAVVEVPWSELDRSLEPDHLTTLWVPVLGAPVGAELLALAELVRRLRERCPWDREQTHASLTRHLLEESYEVVEAIEHLAEVEAVPDHPGLPAAYEHLEEELGDLLFQVYFHATLGVEEGQFDLADIARGIHDKLVSRHPHVFGAVQADTPEAVMTNWEKIKQAERGTDSVMDGVSANLPALSHAHKIQRKAASVGFDWPTIEGPLAKVEEELGEVRLELERSPADKGAAVAPEALTREVGDLLFAAVNVARHAGIDPEAALRASTRTFITRFRRVEEWSRREGVDLATTDPAVVDVQWEAAKAHDSGPGPVGQAE